MPAPRIPIEQRILAKVEKTDGCWIWHGAGVNRPRSYGRIQADAPSRKLLAVHRVLFEIANGVKLNDGVVLMHACDNYRCVNPRHLVVGSHHDNTQDMIRKRRHPYFRLTYNDAEKMRAMAVSLRVGEIAKIFGVHQSTVSKILSGQRQPRRDAKSP